VIIGKTADHGAPPAATPAACPICNTVIPFQQLPETIKRLIAAGRVVYSVDYHWPDENTALRGHVEIKHDFSPPEINRPLVYDPRRSDALDHRQKWS
jgi:hypothetical protein